jgi:hypothetical protein
MLYSSWIGRFSSQLYINNSHESEQSLNCSSRFFAVVCFQEWSRSVVPNDLWFPTGWDRVYDVYVSITLVRATDRQSFVFSAQNSFFVLTWSSSRWEGNIWSVIGRQGETKTFWVSIEQERKVTYAVIQHDSWKVELMIRNTGKLAESQIHSNLCLLHLLPPMDWAWRKSWKHQCFSSKYIFKFHILIHAEKCENT